ncbi:hypothetical protein QEN19_000267 [Hanseniaspora menglaensis]
MTIPIFSKRAYIRWENDKQFNEPTSTWVLTAPNGEFVDTRVHKEIETKHWFTTGFEEIIETNEGYDHSINFVLTLDNLTKWGNSPGSDVGNFKSITESDWNNNLKCHFSAKDIASFKLTHYRLEEGYMANADFQGKIQNYQEIWDTLDANQSRPDSLKPFDEKTKNKVKCEVFKIFDKTKNELGRFITVGKFGMGVAVNAKGEYNAIRVFEGKPIFMYGENCKDLFDFFINGLSSVEWKLTYCN